MRISLGKGERLLLFTDYYLLKVISKAGWLLDMRNFMMFR